MAPAIQSDQEPFFGDLFGRDAFFQQYVGHLEPTTWTKDTKRLDQYPGLIGAKVEDAVRDYYIHRFIW